MALKELLYALVINISILALIASLLSKFQPIQKLLLLEQRSWKEDVFLSFIFAGLIILSTFIGINVNDSYSLNTRVIGAMGAGLLGGPLVGLYSSSIGALFVLIFSTPKLFAKGSAFATILFGLLGSGFYPYFQRGKWKYSHLFLLACFAEVCDMASLLRMTVSLQVAAETVLEVAIPMILLNAVGIVIFISNFNMVFIQQDIESSRQLHNVSELTRKCLPLLQEGILNSQNVKKFISIVLDSTDWACIMITDRHTILDYQFKNQAFLKIKESTIPNIGKRAMRDKKLTVLQSVSPKSPWYEASKDYSVIAVPFTLHEQSYGSMIAWVKKQWLTRQSDIELMQYMMNLCATQSALIELEKQKTMVQRAEFKALQFQVNPHFLFNALNTISCVCREDPEQARDLLIILADYFRYNLKEESYMVPMSEELKHVKDYLSIEKARFEEKLIVTFDVPENLNILIPTLILQPIVENAVRHGVSKDGRRFVHIMIQENPEYYLVCIRDKGKGFPKDVLEKLNEDTAVDNKVGLINVHRRLKSIYGEKNGLIIDSTTEGSCVSLHFYKKEEMAYENRSN